ncbi:MAG: glycine betaine ABC transporter substrate-binding protein [Chryseolinea sp.]
MVRFSTLLLVFISSMTMAQPIRVGSKHFNEGYILSEIISQLLEANGFIVERKYNLGGTVVCFEALRRGEIDLYPEYSGTISSEILKDPKLDYKEIQNELSKKYLLYISQPYGFNNSYGLVCTRENSERYGLHSISDLRQQTQLQFALSYEYLRRVDGWDSLKLKYGLSHTPNAIEHGLAYSALQSGKIDVTDAYTTDGEISKYNLVLLEDDRKFFPLYSAITIYNRNLPKKAKAVIDRLSGTIDEHLMQAMNADVLFGGETIAQVAWRFLKNRNLIALTVTRSDSAISEIANQTLTHLELTFIALVLAILVSVPLAIALYWNPSWASPVVYFTGLLQTIPSIALLAIMIPIFGIGVVPAVIALFLYALLPVLRNTLMGLQAVDPVLKNVADGIGMTRFQKLRYVELPLATPSIMAGIRTAAVINIGTATLAAFIGAGGLGEFIVSGLALNNTSMILKGAIPAAVLALLIEFLFTWLERIITPAHLRRKTL